MKSWMISDWLTDLLIDAKIMIMITKSVIIPAVSGLYRPTGLLFLILETEFQHDFFYYFSYVYAYIFTYIIYHDNPYKRSLDSFDYLQRGENVPFGIIFRVYS